MAGATGTAAAISAPTLDRQDELARLYERYRLPLLRFCHTMLRSWDEAEDAVQHTFLSAFRALRHDVRPAAPKPWLYTIARNRCLTMLRARRAPVPAAAALSTDPADRIELREAMTELLDDVAHLPEEQRTALILSEVVQMSHDEIADVLRCKRVKVKSLVFRARASLRTSRDARDIPCETIRSQLATLRGGSLRRIELRMHLAACPPCAKFRQRKASERIGVAALLPLGSFTGLRDFLRQLAPQLSMDTGMAKACVVGALAGLGLGAGSGSLPGSSEPPASGKGPPAPATAAAPPPLIRTTALGSPRQTLVRLPQLLPSRAPGIGGAASRPGAPNGVPTRVGGPNPAESPAESLADGTAGAPEVGRGTRRAQPISTRRRDAERSRRTEHASPRAAHGGPTARARVRGWRTSEGWSPSETPAGGLPPPGFAKHDSLPAEPPAAELAPTEPAAAGRPLRG